MVVPSITLNDRREIPQLGFGTMDLYPERVNNSDSNETTARIVGEAIATGYRHLDTAQMYVNEKGVGLAVARSAVPRDNFFITSKLGNGNHLPDDVRRSFDDTLHQLGVDRLDLFLMHWPLPTLYGGDYVATWRAMTQLVAQGHLRSAGVSNFNPHHLDRIIDATGHVPAVNQIEVHPYFQNQPTIEKCRSYGIAVEAWSPLSKGTVLEDPAIVRIARAHNRTPAQVVLRWHTQRGRIVIPKSTNGVRMRQNLQSLQFELHTDDLLTIDRLDRDEAGRRGPDPDTFEWIPGVTSRTGAAPKVALQADSAPTRQATALPSDAPTRN